MGANNGTGWPIYFRCSACRRQRSSRPFSSEGRGFTDDVTLTGRTRKYMGGNRGVRGAATHYEYTCRCGHTGWSRHKDLERKANGQKT